METVVLTYEDLRELSSLVYASIKNDSNYYSIMGRTDLIKNLDKKIEALSVYCSKDRTINIELDYLS